MPPEPRPPADPHATGPAASDAAVVDLAAFDGAAFDLDGVVTRTAAVHATAWKRTFDAFLQARAAAGGEPFRPFDETTDYVAHIDGRPRHDGIRAFLAARGIALPEGTPEDPPERDSVHGLGHRKNALFRDLLAKEGVQAYAGSVALLRRLREAGLRTAVVSSSRNTGAVLAAAQLADLFDAQVDGNEAARLHLRGKPAPDTFLHAAAILGIPPSRMLGVEDALAGVEAIRAAGYGLVIGVDRGARGGALAAHGAGLVVSDLQDIALRHVHAVAEAPVLPVAPVDDPAWRLDETGFVLEREHEIESLFAIGNGRLGVRGSLAEGSRLSRPATYAAGVFDRGPDGLPTLAVLPDWTHVEAQVEGERLALESGEVLSHRRTLDFAQGLLFREWRHRDPAGRITRIHGLRFASLADRGLLVQSIAFMPENYSAAVGISATLPLDTVRHAAGGASVAMAAVTRRVDAHGATRIAVPADTPLALRVELGASYRLDRIVAVHGTVAQAGEADGADLLLSGALLSGARAHAARAGARGLTPLVDAHRAQWRERWDTCDVRIDGDDEAQRALRFALYHLIAAADPDDDRVSIGARALTGDAYEGHVFWDTELFMLPFFSLTWPEAARALLRYRQRTLPAARRRAQAMGWKGALFAWESAGTGEDVTPPMVVQPDGRIVRVLTAEQEHHISADVALAAWRHWQWTGDRAFLFDTAAELVFETARFWASRVQQGDDGRGHIRGVIGPDEYHEGVDDNAYTNTLAQWNLDTAHALAGWLRHEAPDAWERWSAELGIDAAESEHWAATARGLHLGFDAATGMIEQFAGYFVLEDIDLAAYASRTAPIDVLLGRERVQRSQLAKQADVVMLLHLFPERWPPAVREKNFRYYEPRCAHGSSLSPAIHAAVAARVGDVPLALRYFRQAMRIDLADNMGNAAGGVHAGALGGLWQAAAFGFGGLEFGEDGPQLHPRLPDHWQGLSLRVRWRGRPYELRAGETASPHGGEGGSDTASALTSEGGNETAPGRSP